MQHARRRSDEPPEHRRLGAILADAEEARARLLAAADALTALAGQPYSPAVLSSVNAGLRQGTAGLDRYLREMAAQRNASVTAGITAAMRAAAGSRRAPAAHRHRRGRKPGPDQPSLFGIPGGKATVAAAGIAASLAAGASLGPVNDLARFSPAPAAHHAQAFAGLSPTVADPIAARVASSPLRRRPYAPRHAKPSPFAATASPVPVPPVVVAVPPVPSGTPSAAPGGALDVQTAMCATGLSGRCEVTFWAVGGDVAWQASASDPALSVDQDGGTLADGESFTVTVSVAAGSPAGSGSVTISDGDGNATQVPVTWVTLPPAV